MKPEPNETGHCRVTIRHGLIFGRLPAALEQLDQQIGEGPFVCGERATIADCTLLAAMNFARLGKLDIVQQYNNLTRWFDLYALRHLS